MPTATVTFQRIDVHNDGEPLQKGKVYWTLNVNGSKASERTASNPVRVSSGEEIDLDVSKEILLDSDQNLTVSGFVGEKDTATSGKDEHADFTRTYTPSQGWSEGERSVRLTDRRLDCTVYYTIDVR